MGLFMKLAKNEGRATVPSPVGSDISILDFNEDNEDKDTQPR